MAPGLAAPDSASDNPMNETCYCLNRTCPRPENPFSATRCGGCGSLLLLGDRYRALKLLGQGATGRTLLGIDTRPDGALDQPQKRCVIQQSWAENHFNRRQFSRYVRRLSQISQHPQVPQLLDVLIEGDRRSLIWEFADGVSLAAHRAEAVSFSEVQVRHLLCNLLPVLAVVHEGGLIHRDVKPENIIHVFPQCPWLVDFGAAVSIGHSTAPAGDARYAAPEQLSGEPVFSSDLYSLGMIGAELLTMASPFDLYAAAQTDGGWQQYLATPVSSGLAQILTQLLRPAPQRYRTAAAVLADLRALPDLELAQPPPSSVTIKSATVEQGVPSNEWTCRHRLKGHRGPVTAIAASESYVVSGGSDGAIRVWSWAGECRQVIQTPWFGKGHRDRISTLSISGDELTLLSGSDDGTLCAWSLVDYGQQTCLQSPAWGVSAIAVMPQVWISGDASGALQLWDEETGRAIERWQSHQAKVSGLAISPNLKILLSGSADGTVGLWDLGTAQRRHQLQVGAAVTAMAVLPRWNVLTLGNDQGQLQIWDLIEMRRLRSLAAHQGPITSVSASPRQLASGGDDGQIHFWQIPGVSEGSFEQQLLTHPQSLTRQITRSHDWSVNAIAFKPAGDWLASGSADETLCLWRR